MKFQSCSTSTPRTHISIGGSSVPKRLCASTEKWEGSSQGRHETRVSVRRGLFTLFMQIMYTFSLFTSHSFRVIPEKEDLCMITAVLSL